MKTAIVSDLHLGTTGGSDVLRDPGIRAVLLKELRGADRLVLLGDVVELRERPLGAALDLALPALAEIGAALGDAEVVLVPGHHDARPAQPPPDDLPPPRHPAPRPPRAAARRPLDRRRAARPRLHLRPLPRPDRVDRRRPRPGP